MAQLKDTVISGSLRVTDTTYTNDLIIGASKTKNWFLGTPSSADGAPTFRALAAADIPTLSITDKTSGTLTVARGGTGLTTASYKNAIITGNGTTVTNAFTVIRTGSGALYATAQDGAAVFGTLPVAQGGTGLTSASYKNAIITGNGTTVTDAFTVVRTASGALYATAQDGAASFGTLPVAQGGTGATSFTANSLIISGNTTTAALTTRAIYDRTSTNALNAVATWANSTNIPTLNTLAYWDGRYQTSSNKSNLAYCSKGAFGDAAVKAVTDSSSASAISTGTSLTTERDVYYGLPQINNSHAYTSSTTIYAPTGGGTAGTVLIAVGATSTPDWYGGLSLSGSAAASYVASFTGTTAATNTTSGAVKIAGGLGVVGDIYANTVHNAIWNDYAEYRKSDLLLPGACVQEQDNGCLIASNSRLIPGCSIITDTFGFSEGKTDEAQTPVAVAGRVLAYTFLPRHIYHAGMAVCSAPGGTIDIMTREEIQQYPDAIIGYVSEIPDYEYWGSGNVKVNGRIWIKIK